MASYKDFDRNIKGYVEVLYDDDIYIPRAFTFLNGKEAPKGFYSSELTNVFTNSRKCDSFLRDGIFYRPEGNVGCYYTLYNSENLEDFYLYIGDDEVPIEKDTNMLTIYMNSNRIIECDINVYKGNDVIETKKVTNSSGCMLLIFNNSLKDCIVEIGNIKCEFGERPIIIEHIDVGATYIYQDNELIEFTITEEVNKLVEETPSNELSLTVGDYDDLFNPLNPQGITKLIDEETKFIAYIGNGDDNYTKMGTFYYNSINHQERQVNIIAYNLMNKLSQVQMRPIQMKRERSPLIDYYTVYKNELRDCIETYISDYYNYDYYIDIVNDDKMALDKFESTNLCELFQTLAMMYGVFYVDRDEKIVVRGIDTTITNSLSLTEQLNEPKYSKENNYKNITYSTEYYSGADVVNKNINLKKKLDKEEIYLAIEVDDLTGTQVDNYNIQFSGVSSVVIDGYNEKNTSFNFIFLKINGNVGDVADITITYTAYASKDKTIVDKKYYDDVISNINISNVCLNSFYGEDYNFTKFIEKIYRYSLNVEYNGDPTIQAGDIIKVETEYGYVPIFIQKHILTFNGGLNGQIEGVEQRVEELFPREDLYPSENLLPNKEGF